MAIETADYISDLQPNLPRGIDYRSEGDDHLRLLKKVIKQTFPGWDSSAGYLTDDIITELNEFFDQNRGMPTGAIVPFHGSVVPDGWFICDGTNGTPNLKDRFVLGWTGDYLPGDVGGSNDKVINGTTEETILRLEELPKHSHSVDQLDNKDDVGDGSVSIQRVGGDENADHAINVVSTEVGGGEGHSHSYTYTATGANLPEFYTLKFIMKG